MSKALYNGLKYDEECIECTERIAPIEGRPVALYSSSGEPPNISSGKSNFVFLTCSLSQCSKCLSDNFPFGKLVGRRSTRTNRNVNQSKVQQYRLKKTNRHYLSTRKASSKHLFKNRADPVFHSMNQHKMRHWSKLARMSNCFQSFEHSSTAVNAAIVEANIMPIIDDVPDINVCQSLASMDYDAKHFMKDTSVDELASYLEHYLYLPKRISHAASMMYS
ncbi:hypothetical protein GJ496_006820 [Pomphorhynchus laevis]|nr:hypothetical protein GJ496_006820 [Pomphorhynchus laevis]